MFFEDTCGIVHVVVKPTKVSKKGKVVDDLRVVQVGLQQWAIVATQLFSHGRDLLEFCGGGRW